MTFIVLNGKAYECEWDADPSKHNDESNTTWGKDIRIITLGFELGSLGQLAYSKFMIFSVVAKKTFKLSLIYYIWYTNYPYILVMRWWKEIQTTGDRTPFNSSKLIIISSNPTKIFIIPHLFCNFKNFATKLSPNLMHNLHHCKKIMQIRCQQSSDTKMHKYLVG